MINEVISQLSKEISKKAEEVYADALRQELSKHYKDYHGVDIFELVNGDLVSMLEEEDIVVVKDGGEFINMPLEHHDPTMYSVKGYFTPVTVKLYKLM